MFEENLKKCRKCGLLIYGWQPCIFCEYFEILRARRGQ